MYNCMGTEEHVNRPKEIAALMPQRLILRSRPYSAHTAVDAGLDARGALLGKSRPLDGC